MTPTLLITVGLLKPKVSTPVGPPYCVAEAQVYVPGAVAMEIHRPGAGEAETYVPGSETLDIYLPGASEGDVYVPGADPGEVQNC